MVFNKWRYGFKLVDYVLLSLFEGNFLLVIIYNYGMIFIIVLVRLRC